MVNYWVNYSQSLANALKQSVATSADGRDVESGAALEMVCEWARTVRDNDATIHFVGNGASACMASHMAVDWTKNAGIRALAYNDVAFLTAIGNDLGYEKVFGEPLLWYGRKGDLLVTISSSGNSPNVLRAIEVAREKEMRVVTFSGMKPDNKSRRAGDLGFYVPGWTYGVIECAHQVLLHAWLDCYMQVREWELTSPQVIAAPRYATKRG